MKRSIDVERELLAAAELLLRGGTPSPADAQLPEDVRAFVDEQAPTHLDRLRVQKAMDGGTMPMLETTTRLLLTLSEHYADVFGDKEGAERLRRYALDFAPHEKENI